MKKAFLNRNPGPPMTTTDETTAQTPLRTTLFALLAVCLLSLLLHAAGLTQYGYFRDELYYLASTYHIDLGYVEHPPLSIWILRVWTMLFGESLAAIRSLSVLAGMATVFAAGMLARALGGRLPAQILAALALAVAPVILSIQHIYSMNVFDQLFWVMAALVLVPVLRGEKKFWLLLGLVLGLGLLNKLSALFLCGGIGVALLLTRHRSVLAGPWPWVAAAVALIVASPYAWWQAARGFPLLEFMRNATEQKMVNPGPAEFMRAQILNAGPLSVPVYLMGIVGVVAFRDLRRNAFFVIAFLTVTAVLVGSGSNKAYYLSPAYPLLLVPGALATERVLSRGMWRTAGKVYTAVIGIAGVAAAPLAIPLLPVDTYLAYSQGLGIRPSPEERNALGALPQYFADMFGWEEFTAEIARKYHSLSAQDQERCAIFVRNYGEAGAIDVLGRKYGLPRAVSGHNTYWYWGPGSYDGEVMIMVGGNVEKEAAAFESIERIGTTPDSKYSMPYERNRPIYLCRKLKIPIEQAWARSKSFI